MLGQGYLKYCLFLLAASLCFFMCLLCFLSILSADVCCGVFYNGYFGLFISY